MKVFLGGTCNGSFWRDFLIPQLRIDYFNPVVEDWTPDCMEEEVRQRESCDLCLYVITPKMLGTFAIAEVVDDSNKRPEKTVFCFVENDDDASFSSAQIKSLKQVAQMVNCNGATVIDSLIHVADYLNHR